MSNWTEVRNSNGAVLTDSEDGWTEALASPRSEIRSPFSEAATDSYVDVGLSGRSSPERSVSPFSLVSSDLERFLPEDPQEWTDEEGSQAGSAHGDNPFDDHNIPKDSGDEDTCDEDDSCDMWNWDTRSVHTVTAQVDPRWLNPKYSYVEEETEDQKEALEADLRVATVESMQTPPLDLTSHASASSSMDQKPLKQEDKPSPYPPKAAEPEGLVELAVCGICNGYYRPAENPLVATLASPSSFKSPYFDPNQASPFPFGLDLYCPLMHGSCIDCMEKHIVNKLQMGSRMAFPVRCPACIKEEDEQGMEHDDDRPVKGWAWEVQDSLAEKVLGLRSMEVWRERKDQ
ncbi:hypothetical protein FS837_011892, partial [Tulasnella sp. UAMH 9824]